uniref:Choline/ethanolamine kinase n=1 Tax=Syphacia muris TaxID=451379 RepID=A0A0N5ADD2_9BILA
LQDIFSKEITDFELVSEARKLCATYVGGVWEAVSNEDFNIRVQSGGLNNFIFAISLPEKLREPGSKVNDLLLKIYFTENEDDILTESVVTVFLSEKHLGPTVFGAFTEGRIEEFIPSRILTNNEFCNIHVGYEIGRILACIHSLDIPISKKDRFPKLVEDMLTRLRTSSRWSQSQKMHTTLFDKRGILCPDEVTLDLLAKEFELSKQCVASSGSPIVFSNNDVHPGNLLLRDGFEVTNDGLTGYPSNVDPLVLIDYEYCSYNYRGFDLCHYCCESCHDNANENWPGYRILQEQWPSDEQQRRFAEGYLDQIDKITQIRGGQRPYCVSDLPLNRELAIKRILTEIKQFAAFPQIIWSIWSFRQAEDFPIDSADFDFFECGFDRLGVYYKWKPEMMKYLN